jgi:hypothetical protein
MPNGGNEVGGAPEPAAGRVIPRRRGFRSQALPLKILLVASVVALAVGMIRCSLEFAGVAPRIGSVGVARVIVALDEGASWAPADSISARAARAFAEALRRESSICVRLAPRGASGFDAIARIRIEGTETGIRVAVGIVDASSGRALFETEGEGAPAMLEGLLNGAAVRVAEALGVPHGTGEGAGNASGRPGVS